jgi:two-component SAPR family response regulator
MPSILVLDDEPTLVKLIVAVLEGAHYEVHRFSKPLDALKALESEDLNPDLFLVDISMPIMTGTEFLGRVRQHERFLRTPFIFLSGLSERHNIRDGMSLGADDYLTKPVDPSEVLRAVEVRLRRAQELAPPESTSVEAFALGNAGLTWAGREVAWGSKKAAEFFFYLLEHPGGSTTWEAAEALWPDKDESRAASVFHTTLHRLRKALEPEAVQSTNRRYFLNTSVSISYDVTRYLEATKALANQSASVAQFDAAILLYRGPYLPNFDSAWCEEKREALHATHLALLLDAIKCAEQQHELRQAAWYAHLATQHEPFADEGWVQLVRLFEQLGDARRAARARARQAGWDD